MKTIVNAWQCIEQDNQKQKTKKPEKKIKHNQKTFTKPVYVKDQMTV